MATPDQIGRVQLSLGPTVLDDTTVGKIIDASESDDPLVWIAMSWDRVAAQYHGLVNISESGSSRSMGDMHKNALAMALAVRKQIAEAAAAVVTVTSGTSTTRRITRI